MSTACDHCLNSLYCEHRDRCESESGCDDFCRREARPRALPKTPSLFLPENGLIWNGNTQKLPVCQQTRCCLGF